LTLFAKKKCIYIQCGILFLHFIIQ